MHFLFVYSEWEGLYDVSPSCSTQGRSQDFGLWGLILDEVWAKKFWSEIFFCLQRALSTGQIYYWTPPSPCLATSLVTSLYVFVTCVNKATFSEITRSVLVLRLSWKWIDRGVKQFSIFKCFDGIKAMLTLY